ncbi:MAG: tetratricopeptide repeat protein [Candidatus Cloacimonetes bacterium]|nr:tetratricopeptide repeat protein [Candidatus Cloacimonadota bacterium]
MSHSSSTPLVKKHKTTDKPIEKADALIGSVIYSFWCCLIIFGILTFIMGNFWLGKVEKTGRYTEAKSLKDQADQLFYSQKYPEAEYMYKKILEIKPDYADAAGNLALTEYMMGRYPEAIAGFKKVITQFNSENHKSYSGIANAYQRMNQPDSAMVYYHKAIQDAPAPGNYYFQAAHLSATRGQFDQAIDLYEKGLEIIHSFDKEYLAMVENLRNIHIVSNSFTAHAEDVDKKIYREMQESIPTPEKLRERYSEVEFLKSLTKQVNLAEAYNNLGLCYAQTGSLEKALSNFEKAIEINPSFKGAQQNIVRVRQQLHGQ